MISEAAGNGAKLVAFPEVYISAYPYWSWVMNPVEASPWFENARSAIELPGRKSAASPRPRASIASTW